MRTGSHSHHDPPKSQAFNIQQLFSVKYSWR